MADKVRAENVRVRYAPSPTGEPHIGNMHSALFEWLFARRHGGKFIVRIEDTDQERVVPGALEAILDGLRWLDMEWDEGPLVGGPYGPYQQSERLAIYQEVGERLIRQGDGYRCYCSRERLDEMRREQERRDDPPGYDGRCRHLSQGQRQDMEGEGGPSVVRFAMPDTGITLVHDLIHGDVEFNNELLDDFIILKADGFPTYHLASVVDDHLMEISHVLRADEWLPSTPRHLQIYRALGFTPPDFAHLPILLGPDRDKLSKRHGATSVLEYRDLGFLPEAVVNFLALLGWSLDDRTEVMSVETLKENFSLERVNHSPAVFDPEKLLWMNGLYVRQLSEEDLADRIIPFLERDFPEEMLPVDREYLLRIVPLIQERIKVLSDAAYLTAYFFQQDIDYNPADLVQRGMDEESTVAALRLAADELTALPSFEHQVMEEALRAAGTSLGLAARQFFGTLRVAVTGRTATPPLFETMEVVGRERVLSRLGSAVVRLTGST
ncbi:MAG: glutamate--tRNA ligase [SAR202 cluster bacterium Io17-Chloro-G9]|nr:MAG: glutamate--tRNA ligase [SAR202 cluster bacterium Io17-Chloro-G9]